MNTTENPDLAEFYTPRQRAENEDGEIENKQHVTADSDPGITEEISPITDQKNDGWCEVEERRSGVMDVLLLEPDLEQNIDSIISFAPGQGNRPLGMFVDKDSEFLSFPTIFCGKRRPENSERLLPVHYSTVCKWELRCQDRREAHSVSNLFYKLKKLQIKRIQDTPSIALRKCKNKGRKVTTGDLKSEGSIKKLINLDEGFRVLRNLRGSPPYFEKCRKDLFAMIRQLGNPTWFCSFSAAETRWSHLLKILGRIVEKTDYSDDQVRAFSWQKKSQLIQSDPVTFACCFQKMVQTFINDFLQSDLTPIGEINDYFYRVEFQQRGSPHIHALFWIKDAPQHGQDENDKILTFVDNYVTCNSTSENDSDKELINPQMHRHAKTCKMKGHKICRFNFPLPSMHKTIILKPLDHDCLDKEDIEKFEERLKQIKNYLDKMKYEADISFSEFLNELSLTEDQYITAIQYSIKRDTLFLKRSPAEIRINNYNANLLKAWKDNMDILFVLDPYACAVYILSYITKGQRGMSRLFEKACEEVKAGNKDILNHVRILVTNS